MFSARALPLLVELLSAEVDQLLLLLEVSVCRRAALAVMLLSLHVVVQATASQSAVLAWNDALQR